MKKTALISSLLFAAPLAAFAQTTAGLRNIEVLVQGVGNIVNLLIPILIGLALVFFFWGLIKYIRTSGEGHAEGRNMMIAGLVSLFVMVSVWGIIQFAQSALGIGGNTSTYQAAPRIPNQF